MKKIKPKKLGFDGYINETIKSALPFVISIIIKKIDNIEIEGSRIRIKFR